VSMSWRAPHLPHEVHERRRVQAMSRFNLPPGTDPKDISDPDECPTCGGSGRIERSESETQWEEWTTKESFDCPDCSGLGVRNKRVREEA
jgi:DnaJ-class molecular chaperone